MKNHLKNAILSEGRVVDYQMFRWLRSNNKNKIRDKFQNIQDTSKDKNLENNTKKESEDLIKNKSQQC